MTNFDSQIARAWADDLQGPVALHLRQILVPVEGDGTVIFPPTYAKEGRATSPYALDKLANGESVVQVDSVGSQANRMEPVFKREPEGSSENAAARLVPQIDIEVSKEMLVSIFDVGHRLGDALVRSSELADSAKNAFAAYQLHGDATPIAKLAPTSLVFGAWDSRGEGAKLPRIVQSTVRAWNVDELKRSAQYFPPINYAKHDVFSADEAQKAEGNAKNPLAQQGFVAVPSVDAAGGVLVRGQIVREVTVNLVALRRLGSGADAETGAKLRRYVLGLALVAATNLQDGFYRQGCLLTPNPDFPATWSLVQRSGVRVPLELTAEGAMEFANTVASEFGVGADRVVKFEKERAKADLPKSKAKAKG
jgi:CRISPR-associated protein Csb1